MTNDERPKPRYGEYATPQHQAETVAHSLPPVAPVLLPQEPAAETLAARPDRVTPAESPRPAAPKKRRLWDIVLSSGLLALGLYSVLSGFVVNSDLGQLIQQVYDTQGVGEFTSNDLAGTVGIVASVVNALVFVLAVMVTVRLLRAGRIAFYVPLISGAITGLVSLVVVMILMFADPAFMAYIDAATQ